MKKVMISILAVGVAMTSKTSDAFTIKTSAFTHNGAIPMRYTCDGENYAPELSWSGAPHGTQSYALIVDDPDAPSKTWVHWVLYNIPASVQMITPQTAQQYPAGLNDFGTKLYGGPCPPSGTHHYHFTLYALDTMLSMQGVPTKQQLLQAMKGHTLGTAKLVGTYEKQK